MKNLTNYWEVALRNGGTVRFAIGEFPPQPDKQGILWTFLGYSPATNTAVFGTVREGAKATREIEVCPLALAGFFEIRNLCRMFGWKGGTVHQVMDALCLGEVARARA